MRLFKDQSQESDVIQDILTSIHLVMWLTLMVLGKLPVPGCPTIWMIVGQGPNALAIGAGRGVVWTFLLSSILSLLFLPLFGRRPDTD